MAATKKIPAIRFKGFEEGWEERELREVVDIISTGKSFFVTNEKSDKNQYPILGSTSIIGYENDFDYSGDFLLTARVGANAGNLYQYSGNVKISDNTVFIQGKNVDFIFYLLEKFGLKRLSFGTGQPLIKSSELAKLLLKFPLSSEQTQIGNYFKQLDNLIQFQERKLEKATNLKKAMLEKMFPKENADVPEIRFKGFTEKWEKRNFRDNIVSIQTGTNFLGNTTNTGTPLIKMGNIQRGSFSFDKIEYLHTSVKVEKENIAYFGDFLFNTRNTLELVGKGATWMGVSGKFAFNNNIARFIFRDIDTIFFNYLYNTQYLITQVHARAMGTTSVAAIYPQNLNSIVYSLPHINEQIQIGNYFKNIDQLISQSQKEIEQLKHLKQALLQKMFI